VLAEYDKEWRERYHPRLDQCTSLIRDVHSATTYSREDFIENQSSQRSFADKQMESGIMRNTKARPKLIEVALPLEAINIACKADKDRKTGHIRNIHKWFAPMPLPALRAIIFSALVDAPEDEAGVRKMLDTISALMASGPESPSSESLSAAKRELRNQVDQDVYVLDPFCGGGSTLVEAQRLGLSAEGSDLNPIPLLISRALTVLPVRNRGRAPVGQNALLSSDGALDGFETDIREYAGRIKEAALKQLRDVYPAAPNGDPVLYWWWAHTVPSPNPAFSHCHTPLVTTWWLSRQSGNEQFLVPLPNSKTGKLAFRIERTGEPPKPSKDRCVFSNDPISYKYVREQAKKGNLRRMLLAVVSDGKGGRKHWVPDETQAKAAAVPAPDDLPVLAIPKDGLGISVHNYGFENWADLFCSRQQVMLKTFSDLIKDVPNLVRKDGGSEQQGRDIAMFLGLCLGKLAQASSTIVRVYVRDGPVAQAKPAFARGDIQLNWDFAETNPFAGSVGDWDQTVTTALRAYKLVDPTGPLTEVRQADARKSGSKHPGKYVVVTDPPYFAAIGYADLSEYFYYWMRLALRDICPDLFSTMGVPKTTELIASPARHGGKGPAAKYFVDGFTEAFQHLSRIAHPEYPTIVVYAQKQEEQSAEGEVSTGWEAMLEAMIEAGLGISGTWPISGTGSARMRAHGANSLASYIVMVCRPRGAGLPAASVREFLAVLKSELPNALHRLQQASIAPVDLAQAAIGPGMAVFTRYSKVVEADGSSMKVRKALSLINATLDEVLAAQEGEFDADTRWALTWFEQFGVDEGPFGVAETLTRAKNTAVNALELAGLVKAKGGKVRLLKRDELPEGWNPATDTRLRHWEVVQHLIRSLELDGESAAANLLRQLSGGMGEIARDLAYRLFSICERKGWSQEGLAYNSLVISWPEISRLAQSTNSGEKKETQSAMF
jgi:putative DNA methylase